MDVFKAVAVVVLVAIAAAAFITGVSKVVQGAEEGRETFTMTKAEPVTATGSTVEGYSPWEFVKGAMGAVLGGDEHSMTFGVVGTVLFGGIALIVAFALWGIAAKVLGG